MPAGRGQEPSACRPLLASAACLLPAHSAAAAHALVVPPIKVMGLKLLFEELDTDRDGLLSLPELREGLAKKGDMPAGEAGWAG